MAGFPALPSSGGSDGGSSERDAVILSFAPDAEHVCPHLTPPTAQPDHLLALGWMLARDGQVFVPAWRALCLPAHAHSLGQITITEVTLRLDEQQWRAAAARGELHVSVLQATNVRVGVRGGGNGACEEACEEAAVPLAERAPVDVCTRAGAQVAARQSDGRPFDWEARERPRPYGMLTEHERYSWRLARHVEDFLGPNARGCPAEVLVTPLRRTTATLPL